MNKKALQTIAACMVYDSDMSKPAKIQLINFIESATLKQLQHYIIHGDIVKEENAQVVEGFFIAAALIGAAAAAGRAIYDQEFSKAAKSCQNMRGVAKKSCMKRFKLRGVSGQINALRKEMGKCNQTARPDKCRKMFSTYIKNAETKMRKIQQSD
jgi:hypothetical protein